MTSDVTSCEVIQWQFVLSTADSTYTAGNSTLSKDEPCHWINMFQYSSFFSYFCNRFNLKIWLQNTFPHCSCQCRLSYGLYRAPAIGVCGALCCSTSTKWNMTNDIWHLTSQPHNSQPWHLTSDDIWLFPNMTKTSDIWHHSRTIPSHDIWHLMTSDIALFPAISLKVLTAPSLTWLGTPSRLTWPGTPRRTPLTWLGTPSRLTWLGSVLLGLRSIWCWWCWQSFRSTRAQRWIHDFVRKSHLGPFIIWDQSSFNCFRHSRPQRSAKSVTFNTFSDIFCKYHEAM